MKLLREKLENNKKAWKISEESKWKRGEEDGCLWFLAETVRMCSVKTWNGWHMLQYSSDRFSESNRSKLDLKENKGTLLLSFKTEMSLFRCHSKTRTFKNLICYSKSFQQTFLFRQGKNRSVLFICLFMFSKDGFKSHKPSAELSLTNTQLWQSSIFFCHPAVKRNKCGFLSE